MFCREREVLIRSFANQLRAVSFEKKQIGLGSTLYYKVTKQTRELNCHKKFPISATLLESGFGGE